LGSDGRDQLLSCSSLLDYCVGFNESNSSCKAHDEGSDESSALADNEQIGVLKRKLEEYERVIYQQHEQLIQVIYTVRFVIHLCVYIITVR